MFRLPRLLALALSFPCLHIILPRGIGKREGSPDYSPLSIRVLELRDGFFFVMMADSLHPSSCFSEEHAPQDEQQPEQQPVQQQQPIAKRMPRGSTVTSLKPPPGPPPPHVLDSSISALHIQVCMFA